MNPRPELDFLVALNRITDIQQLIIAQRRNMIGNVFMNGVIAALAGADIGSIRSDCLQIKPDDAPLEYKGQLNVTVKKTKKKGLQE